MKSVEFKQPYYRSMIDQVLIEHQFAPAEAKLQATAMMTAGAFIAEAIAHALEEQNDCGGMHSAVGGIASELANVLPVLERIAAAAENIQ